MIRSVHSSVEVTEHTYGHMSTDELKKVISRTDEVFQLTTAKGKENGRKVELSEKGCIVIHS